MKTGAKELANNSIGNALRYFWKPQSYMPSWSKSVKDKKETDEIMPKLLRKYGAYVFEYALADNKRREEIPNIQKLKEDILRNYNDVKEANGDFYKVLTLLRKSALNVEIIAQVIPNDVTVANFQQIRNNYAQLNQQQQIFLDEATKKIPYILKYWVTTSRSDDIDQELDEYMKIIIENIRNLNTNQIFTDEIKSSQPVQRYFMQLQQDMEKGLQQQLKPLLDESKKVDDYATREAQKQAKAQQQNNVNNEENQEGTQGQQEQENQTSVERIVSERTQELQKKIVDKQIYLAMVNNLLSTGNLVENDIINNILEQDGLFKIGGRNGYNKTGISQIIHQSIKSQRMSFAEFLQDSINKAKQEGYDDYDEKILRKESLSLLQNLLDINKNKK